MRVNILEANLDCLTMTETIARVNKIIKNKERVQHVAINANKINLMQKDEKLRAIVNQSDLINADGQSILLAGKILGVNVPERVTGIDLFERLIKECAENNYRPYFFGAEQEVVERVVTLYTQKFPDLTIAGFRNGYFTDEDSLEIAEEIAETKADILFVAFSSPKKEFWINDHMDQLKIPFVMGVGGSFDVVAGKISRAPIWMQKTGLEWFHRFINEPRRMFKRYIIGNIIFLKLVIKEKLMRRSKKND